MFFMDLTPGTKFLFSKKLLFYAFQTPPSNKSLKQLDVYIIVLHGGSKKWSYYYTHNNGSPSCSSIPYKFEQLEKH